MFWAYICAHFVNIHWAISYNLHNFLYQRYASIKSTLKKNDSDLWPIQLEAMGDTYWNEEAIREEGFGKKFIQVILSHDAH
jgi:hypothetical protein